MINFYVPYSGDEPATVCVKGHSFLILSRKRFTLECSLTLIGADSLMEIASENSGEEDENLDELARKIDAGIVIAPEDISVSDILVNLESELPWLH